MLGWIIVFALLALIGAILAPTAFAAQASVRMAGGLFGALFVLGILTCAIRGRT
jgi:hypothetical protein